MKSKTYFYNSMGTNKELTDFNWLKNKVFSGDDLFWEGATGSCGLSYEGEEITGSLTIIGRESHGFMVDHNFPNELIQSLRYGEHTGETIEAETGGNPDLYFKEYFVPKEIAWQAIEYFLKTGERDPSLTWEIAELVETV
jgi:hypothetical protein